jgi:hypothetical protein
MLVAPAWSACVALAAGCKTCTGTAPNETCNTCLPGFKLATDVCTACEAGKTANLATPWTGTDCANVDAGYYTILSNPAVHNTLVGNPPALCADGKGAAAGAGITSACIVTCTGDGINVCTGVVTEAVTCKAGYYKDALTC